MPKNEATNELPLRLAVPASYPASPTRDVRGRLLGGEAEIGAALVISPADIRATLEGISLDGDEAVFTLDREVSFSGPAMIAPETDLPIETDVFRIGFDAGITGSFTPGQEIDVEIAMGRIGVTVQSITENEIVVRAPGTIAIDTYERQPDYGRARIYDGDAQISEGRVGMEGYADQRELRTVRATNITRVAHRVSSDDRCGRHGHSGGVLWLTGLSGSGKSTLAVELEIALFNRGYQVYVLDGDNIRHGLNANLGFSPEDRSENIRRVGEVAALFARAGFIAVSAFISPYQSDRERARAAAGEDFHEIYVNAGLETCEQRDPKGLYKQARAGSIPDFTGISAPYEAPDHPDLVVDTENLDVAESVAVMIDYISEHFTVQG